MIFPKQLPNYNAFVYLAFTIIMVFYVKSVAVYSLSFILISIVALFSLANGSGMIYIMIDSAIIFYIISSISTNSLLYFKPKIQKVTLYIIAFLIIASILNIANPTAYEEIGGDIRYQGLFAGGNSSASMFAIFSILLWKMPQTQNLSNSIKKLLLISLIAALILYFLASQTRTMLLVLPYWMYQLSHLFSRKLLILSLVILIAVSGSIFNYLQENGRMEEDGSYLTRSSLYLAQIIGIIDNYVIIPHGANGAKEMIDRFTGDKGFSTHNDFLRYLYDWGGVFLFLVFFIVKKVKECRKINLELLLIFLAYSGCALHNILFLPYVWIPLILVLTVSEPKNVFNDRKLWFS